MVDLRKIFLKASASKVNVKVIVLLFSVVPIPQQVSLSANLNTQQVSISWDGEAASTFDLLIVRTELNDTVFYETLTVAPAAGSVRREFNWTSAEPLECTSLSVKVRSRSGEVTSEWSSTQILQGNDLPINEKIQVYPQDKIVPAGTNVTFCCIIGEGKSFESFHFISSAVNVTRLSRRTFAATVYNVKPSPPTAPTRTWTEARNTHLTGKRQTHYSINGRYHNRKQCNVPLWEDKWTLLGLNPLGEHNLTDTADIRSRVVPLPPEELSTVYTARNATVTWQWKRSNYSTLALVCQVELTSSDNKTKRTFSGMALQSVVLLDLIPYEEYSIKVRCGAQRISGSGGTGAKPFLSKLTVKVTPGSSPDVWMWMNSDQTGQVIWKPYEPRQSHGPIVSYEVSLWSPDDNTRHTQILSPDTFTMPVIARVVAKNPVGLSPPASVVLPQHVTLPDSQAVTKADCREGAFALSWQSDANSSCGYIVEWHKASCRHDCAVEWIKVGEEISNVSIKSDTFEPGVRYFFSLYSCTSEAPELLQQWQGYMRELSTSIQFCQLSPRQQDSSTVLLTWSEIPAEHQRGFLLGYKVYINNGSQFTLLADWLILEILATLGTLDVKPSPHSMVHIVDKPEWDSSKEALVVIPEEDEDDNEGQGIRDEPVDTDEPTSLRYYNQVDDRPIRPRYPDSSASSASSLDSARTDVTYTGIQTSGSLCHQPIVGSVSCGGADGYRPQTHPQPQGNNADSAQPQSLLESLVSSSSGYRPQNNWHLDSPGEADERRSLAPSLGSPTSIASTQFLLPDGSSDDQADEKPQTSSSAATWFSNLLSSAKP
uniref:Uncharacterized protein n=1 Tax=Neogobius melanostomus TaxID=47308 RepID=A0A8C6ULQ7_9GOBI